MRTPPCAARTASSLLTRSSAARHEECGEACDAVVEPLLRRRETPAHEPFALRPERTSGREAELRLVHERAAERHAVGKPGDAEKRVHRTGRRRRLYAGQ